MGNSRAYTTVLLNRFVFITQLLCVADRQRYVRCVVMGRSATGTLCGCAAITPLYGHRNLMPANPSSPCCFGTLCHTLSKQLAIAMGLAHLAFRPERKERQWCG
jgi:hypothetical protein